jgi:hypothetical protein
MSMSPSTWSRLAHNILTLLCAPAMCVLLVAATSVLRDDRVPMTRHVMVKHSKQYAQHKTRPPSREAFANARDIVFTHYAR